MIKKSLLKFKKAELEPLLVSTKTGTTTPVKGLYSAIASTLVPDINHITFWFSLSIKEPIHLAPVMLWSDFSILPYEF